MGTLAAPALAGLAWTQLNRSDLRRRRQEFYERDQRPRRQSARGPSPLWPCRGPATVEELSGAAEDIEAYLKSEPKSAQRSDARYVLGLAQEGLKKNAEAAETFNKLLTADPNYGTATRSCTS